LTPADSVDALRPWITARLDPLNAWDPVARAVHSDYDLAPDLHPGAVPLTAAAVLVPLVEHETGLTVLLTRRADAMRKHSGQVAFPGGRSDPGEAPWTTALREAEEEIGLDPARVAIAGLSSTYETVTGYRITPVVGFVRPGFEVRPNAAEVADVFETPFAWLMDPVNTELHHHDRSDGVRRHFYAMPWEDRLIWGATAGMLRALRHRLFGPDEVRVNMIGSAR
jgi:8-oxo-dGTP pyrophosphatase MutT (NUDIX family)